jgi:F-type H+-transporting ATPase subunit a
MSGALHISISAEPITTVGSLVISNSILTSLIVSALIIGFALVTRLTLSKKLSELTPLQNLAEFIIEALYGLVQSVTASHKKTQKFMPLIVGFFVFILINNWFGLLPGVGTIGIIETKDGHKTVTLAPETITVPAVSQAFAATKQEAVTNEDGEPIAQEKFIPLFRAGTADLNTTIALALVTMFSVQYWGVSYLQLAYFKKFFDFSNPIMFFVGILELISDFSKVLSFAFRLFGNIFAGEVLLTVIGALVPLVVPMVFYGLEIFVGAIQALVFTLLSLIFYYMATISHEEH